MKVAFLDGLLPRAPESFRAFLAGSGIEPVEAVADAEAVVCFRLTPADTADATRLRLVQAMSAGADHVDPEALPPGCSLCNVRGHEQAMAEWVVMAMLALRWDLVILDRDFREGRWKDEDARERRPDLAEHTVGTVGLGPIGVEAARRARCLGMRALGVTRSPSHERAEAAGLEWLGSLDDRSRLLREVDFAVVCLPLRPETEGLIGKRELEALGPQGFLVNVARGRVVDEKALYEALRDRTIAGAALDVWYRYPSGEEPNARPSEFPFWELDNVVMTPHVSGSSATATRKRWEFIAAQLRRLAAGEPLENVLAMG